MPRPVNLLHLVGPSAGHFKHKHNRARKLLDRWGELEEKFVGMVERGGGESYTARCAYGLLVMMETGIRIGNETSAEGFVCINKFHPDFGKEVRTYGLTTLLNEHVVPGRRRFLLSFTGKKLVSQELEVRDPLLVEYRPRGPAPELWLGISKYELTKFVKKYVGWNFCPKDLRIAKVNLEFCRRFARRYAGPFAAATRQPDRKRVVSACIEETAAAIGHTKAVSKSAYLSSPMLDNILLADVGTRFVFRDPATKENYGEAK